jgi:hypothetical protein
MDTQNYFYLTGIIGGIFSIIFSAFMMFTMWKTYRTAKKASKNLQKGVLEIKNNIEQVGNALGNVLGGNTQRLTTVKKEIYLEGEEVEVSKIVNDKGEEINV